MKQDRRKPGGATPKGGLLDCGWNRPGKRKPCRRMAVTQLPLGTAYSPKLRKMMQERAQFIRPPCPLPTVGSAQRAKARLREGFPVPIPKIAEEEDKRRQLAPAGPSRYWRSMRIG